LYNYYFVQTIKGRLEVNYVLSSRFLVKTILSKRGLQ
jgi:hypothetical protein